MSEYEVLQMFDYAENLNETDIYLNRNSSILNHKINL